MGVGSAGASVGPEAPPSADAGRVASGRGAPPAGSPVVPPPPVTVPPPLLVSPTSFAFDCTPADFPAGGIRPNRPAPHACCRRPPLRGLDASGRPPSKAGLRVRRGSRLVHVVAALRETLTESDFSSEAPGISTHGASEFPRSRSPRGPARTPRRPPPSPIRADATSGVSHRCCRRKPACPAHVIDLPSMSARSPHPGTSAPLLSLKEKMYRRCEDTDMTSRAFYPLIGQSRNRIESQAAQLEQSVFTTWTKDFDIPSELQLAAIARPLRQPSGPVSDSDTSSGTDLRTRFRSRVPSHFHHICDACRAATNGRAGLARCQHKNPLTQPHGSRRRGLPEPPAPSSRTRRHVVLR